MKAKKPAPGLMTRALTRHLAQIREMIVNGSAGQISISGQVLDARGDVREARMQIAQVETHLTRVDDHVQVVGNLIAERVDRLEAIVRALVTGLDTVASDLESIRTYVGAQTELLAKLRAENERLHAKTDALPMTPEEITRRRQEGRELASGDELATVFHLPLELRPIGASRGILDPSFGGKTPPDSPPSPEQSP